MTQPTKARQTLNALAARQEAVLTRIESRTDEKRRVWKSDPTTWSLAQVVHHLGLSGRSMLEAERPRHKRGSTVKYLVMRVVLKSPARLKLPAGLPIIPAPTIHWDEAVATARGALQAWSAHLETRKDDMLFMHPFAGPLTTEQTVTFLQDHFEHHVMQIERLLRKVGTAV